MLNSLEVSHRSILRVPQILHFLLNKIHAFPNDVCESAGYLLFRRITAARIPTAARASTAKSVGVEFNFFLP